MASAEYGTTGTRPFVLAAKRLEKDTRENCVAFHLISHELCVTKLWLQSTWHNSKVARGLHYAGRASLQPLL